MQAFFGAGGPPGAPQAAFDGKKYLIGGNWKCNGTKASTAALVKTLNEAGPIPARTPACHGVLPQKNHVVP